MSRKTAQTKPDAMLRIGELISIREMQARLGVSRATVTRLKQRIPHYYCGDRVLFDWSEVQSYLAKHCRVEPSPRARYRPRLTLPDTEHTNRQEPRQSNLAAFAASDNAAVTESTRTVQAKG